MKYKNIALIHAILVFFFLPVLSTISTAKPFPQTQTTTLQDTMGMKILKVRPGDRCIVCDTPLDEGGLAVLYRGRRVPVFNGEMLEKFLKNPAKHFSKLQPAGALFQESTAQNSGMRLGWFFFGLWVVAALVSAALSANIALRKGLPAIRWFFTGLVLSIAGLLLAWQRKPHQKVALPAGLAKIPTTSKPMACSECGAENHPSAQECTGCGAKLEPESESEVSRIGT